jgi:hypothetical protein
VCLIIVWESDLCTAKHAVENCVRLMASTVVNAHAMFRSRPHESDESWSAVGYAADPAQLSAPTRCSVAASLPETLVNVESPKA